MLVFGATLEEVEQARDSVIYLLKNLGFVINYKKSILTPTQIIEFLGVLIDSLKMTMSIPLKKANKLKALCQHTLMVKTITVKELSSVIGKLNATSPAFTHAQLQIRYLQRALIKAETTTYKDKVYLNKKARLELKWWLKNIHLMNGKPITINPPDMTIASDAAKTGGWGAECHGQETGGPWNREEMDLHINELEGLAAKNAILTFTKLVKPSVLHLKIDNMTALKYLAKMGGTQNEYLIDIAKEVHTYLASKKITLTLEYIPSKLNIRPDWQSRNWKDSSEWMLNHSFFLKICKAFGTPQIDLFASRTSHQLKDYYSWRPDPHSRATNALCQNWTYKYLYAFPPFCLIGQCLQKTIKHQNRLIIITPVLTTSPWYPLLLEMCIKAPILLPQQQNILLNPKGETHPLIRNSTLRLAAWLISGKTAEQINFQEQLTNFSLHPDQKELEKITSQTGKSLHAGAVKGKLIPFRVI